MLEPRQPRVPGVRISDADRDAAVADLRAHCGAGRLTLDEFSDRAELVYAARTWDEIDAAFVELPVEDRGLGTAVTEAEAPPPIPRRKVRRWIVSILGGSDERGRWRPAEETNVVAFMGGAAIDLRQAEFDHPEITINAVVCMGGVDILVPEGIDVELSGFILMGGKDKRIRNAPVLRGAPRVRVRAFGMMGGVSVKTKSGGERLKEQIEAGLARAVEARTGIASSRGGRRPEGTVTVLAVETAALAERDRERVAALLRDDGGYVTRPDASRELAAFAGVAAALRCAATIAAAFDPAPPMGLHTGEEDVEATAASVVRRAAEGEVLATSLVRELARGTVPCTFVDAGQLQRVVWG